MIMCKLNAVNSFRILKIELEILRVVESRMIEIMTNACRDEDAKIFLGQIFVQFA